MEDQYFGDKFDVIVVGAGVMGSATAYQLAKRGQKTLLLEQYDFLHHRGSSHGESRTIRATYPEDYYYGMVAESAKLWEDAQSEIGYRVYFKAQHFDMGPAHDLNLRAVIASCQKHSIPHQLLDRRQVADKFSGLIDIPENWVGLSTELTKAVSMFQSKLLQSGGESGDGVWERGQFCLSVGSIYSGRSGKLEYHVCQRIGFFPLARKSPLLSGELLANQTAKSVTS